jgi:hypothetical protein
MARSTDSMDFYNTHLSSVYNIANIQKTILLKIQGTRAYEILEDVHKKNGGKTALYPRDFDIKELEGAIAIGDHHTSLQLRHALVSSGISTALLYICEKYTENAVAHKEDVATIHRELSTYTDNCLASMRRSREINNKEAEFEVSFIIPKELELYTVLRRILISLDDAFVDQ